MGKGKGMNRNGGAKGRNAITIETVDPILAAALARTDVSPHGGISTNNDLKNTPEFVAVGEDSEKSADDSQTLWEEDLDCTPSVRRNVSVGNSVSAGGEAESSAMGETPKQIQTQRKATYASHFANNRLPSLGSQLEHFDLEDGPIQIEADEVEVVPWVRHRSKLKRKERLHTQATLQIIGFHHWEVSLSTLIWKMGLFKLRQMRLKTHGSHGKPALWAILVGGSRERWRFNRLLLHGSFKNEEISSFPVWIQLLDLLVDKLTEGLGCLVEINMARDLPDSVMLKMPNGDALEQAVFYENFPRFCPHCKVIGHSMAGCPGKNKGTAKGQGDAKGNGPSTVQKSQQPKAKEKTAADFQPVRNDAKGCDRPKPKPNSFQIGNKYGVLTKLSEAGIDQSLASWSDDGGVQAPKDRSDQVQESPEQQDLQLGSDANPQLIQQEASGQQNLEAQTETTQNKGKVTETLGTAVYIQQAQQIASGEVGLKSEQNSVAQAKPRQNLAKADGSLGNCCCLFFHAAGSQCWCEEKEGQEPSKGFNKPLKQNGILEHIRKNKVVVMGILETKLKQQRMKDTVRKKFSSWKIADSFHNNPNGRILIIWKEDKVALEILESSDQTIHCLATSKSSSNKFCISFIYAFNTIVGRRPLWENLRRFSSSIEMPWLLLGDFNNVLKDEEKSNGLPVTQYKVRDFMDCCYDIGITDLRSTGAFFTGSNNKVWNKLDRAMVNVKWGQEGLIAQANFGLPGLAGVPIGHGWCDGGGKQSHHGRRRAEIEGRERERRELLCIPASPLPPPPPLRATKQQLHDNTGDASLQNEVAILRVKSFRLAKAERSYCSQLAKAKARSRIVALTKEDGASTTSIQQDSWVEVTDPLKNRESALLPQKRDGNASQSRQNRVPNRYIEAYLLKSPGMEKTLSSLQQPTRVSLGSAIRWSNRAGWKSPGTEKTSVTPIWTRRRAPAHRSRDLDLSFLVAVSVARCRLRCSSPLPSLIDISTSLTAVKEFFVSGKLLKQLNHAVIALVPKLASASRVEEFRPIACCNVIYKVISKILAARLSPILESLIDPGQSAFVPNRSMVENIYVVQELLRNYGWSRISPRCIMKVDLRKAYDTVNWAFLEDVLLGLGFPSLFVQWIMQCASTTSYSISINGSLHGFFKDQQGLRQGDPISPFLFVLCLEYLSRNLRRLKMNPDFNFHPKCAALNISHLAFADDLMLFQRDVTSMSLIMDCLKKFGECSGLRINDSKSNIFMAGISRGNHGGDHSITGFNAGRFPFRYLGIPVAASRLTIEQFNPFITKIFEYINAWAGATLSYAGRSELIRSVLQGVECFWLSILPIPVGVREKVIALCRNFLWGGRAVVSKKPLVAWKELCRPKSEGGLGFMDLHAWNLALLSKSLWNLQSKKDSLSVKWVHHIYIKRTSFWEYVPAKQNSQMIRQLAQIRDIATIEGSLPAALIRMQQWTSSGKFNTKACYDFFRSKGANICWTNLVWHHSLLPKHSFILWLGLKDRLLTRDKLMDQIVDTSCSLCNNPIESLNHLFFQCSVVNQVWTEIKNWLGFSWALTTLKAAAKWIIKEARGTGVQAIAKKVGFACTIYCIWVTRNARKFEG
ncbi:pyruvate decarboxylase-2 [Actinidia rufa]|uniref:Pyruvate decarboxylase-2 n=1 Tax=Actinidia rufa TaxID=165716 RepID=A0A7J0F2S7_9ERIC|nr:pyruvate decarboxylase-2 [Actinidia rufa]